MGCVLDLILVSEIPIMSNLNLSRERQASNSSLFFANDAMLRCIMEKDFSLTFCWFKEVMSIYLQFKRGEMSVSSSLESE